MSSNKTIKLSAEITDEAAEALRELAKVQGISLNQALNRAIGNERTLVKKRYLSNAKIFVQEDGKISEVIFEEKLK